MNSYSHIIDDFLKDKKVVVETDFFKVYQLNDGIIINRIKEHKVIDEEQIIEIVEKVNQFLGESRQPSLFIPAEFMNFTKKAKALAGSEFATINSMGRAVLVNNLAHQIIYNAYKRLSRSKIPNKAFSNIEDALKWLRKLKQ